MMRNGTPTGKNKSDGENEKNSAKKLVQARLPFKILAPGSTPSSETSTAMEDADKVVNVSLEARKRKLSYDSNEEVEVVEKTRRSGSKENVKDTGPKKQKTVDDMADEVVLLDDSSEEEEVKAQKSSTKSTPKTKAVGAAGKGKKTPKNMKSGEQRKSSGGSGQKMLIKLPLSNSKKHKKRKTVRKINTELEDDDEHVEDAATAESSDDIEMLAGELNPQKKPKHDQPNKEEQNEKTKEIVILDVSDTDKVESDIKESPKKSRNKEIKSSLEKPKSPNEDSLEKTSLKVSDNTNDQKNEEDNSSLTPSSTQSKQSSDSKPQVEEDPDISLVQTEKSCKEMESEDDNQNSEDNEDDDGGEHEDKESDINSSKSESFIKLNDSSLGKNKVLTAKQKRYLLQRRKAREEKERKLMEEKRQKQLEKEEKELAKKKDREEKEEQKRKEREEKEEQRKREKEEREEQKRKEKEEKDEQKRKEKEEKEKKRLAEIEAKKKRIEAKEEEQRKKDDDKRRKEQEKEEAELKKRKAAEAFSKFFVAKPSNPNYGYDFDQVSNDSNSVNETTLAFRPFQIKGDMKMAPILRKILTSESKLLLDKILNFEDSVNEEESLQENLLTKDNLYLKELKSGKITPAKWRKQAAEYETKDDDVILVEDDLEREGQEIIEESHPPVELYRAKFYKFHENRRPPYYGTWRKKSEKITPRKPFVQDQKYFDYEVDSDLEWEEEEPGESLDGSDDDKEKESEDEDYEVDNEWFVPHGHLSEEEMQNEDEIGGEDDNTREAQKAKLKLLQQEFAQEMKKKTEKIKPRLVGCIWVDENGNHPDLCPKIIWEKLNSRAMLFTEPPLVEEPTNPERPEPSSPSNGTNTNGNGNDKTSEKLRPMVINSKLQKDLIRLIHGNTNSKVFLIKEFIAFVEANEDSVKNGDFKGPLKSAVKDKIDEFAEWKIMELNGITTKSKKTKKHLCWVVNEAVLEKMDMKELDLKNDWQYLLTPKRREAPPDITTSNDTTNEPAASTIATAPTATEAEASLPQDSGKNQQTLDNQVLKHSKKKIQKPLDANPSSSPCSSPSTVTQGPKSLSVAQKNEIAQNERKEEPPSKKKRVALLMSVARGQQFATPTKNALISQFLKKSSEAREQKEPSEQNTPNSTDVIVLE